MSKNYDSKRIKGKFRVYQYLRAHNKVKKHLPYTVILNKKTLQQITARYPLLYVKPNQGTHGNGVIQLKWHPNTGAFTTRSVSSKRKFKNISKLYRYLRQQANHRMMLIQQGIQLEKVNGNPYDIRVMVQRKPHGSWNVTGIFTKVALPKKFLTNYAQGGKILLLEETFRQLHLSSSQTKSRNRLLSKTSLKVAKALSSRQKGMYEMGIDFAFDQQGRLWIIEVNTRRPQFYPLKKMNSSMYRKMLTFAKSYGRTSAF